MPRTGFVCADGLLCSGDKGSVLKDAMAPTRRALEGRSFEGRSKEPPRDDW